jgi:hypothetical protein
VLGWRLTVAFPEIVARMIRAECDDAPGPDGLSAEARFPVRVKSL